MYLITWLWYDKLIIQGLFFFISFCFVLCIIPYSVLILKYFPYLVIDEYYFLLMSIIRYLHEVCEPPVVHRNFKSANILLDDELNVRASDCGLASLIASGSVSQVRDYLRYFSHDLTKNFAVSLVVENSSSLFKMFK